MERGLVDGWGGVGGRKGGLVGVGWVGGWVGVGWVGGGWVGGWVGGWNVRM